MKHKKSPKRKELEEDSKKMEFYSAKVKKAIKKSKKAPSR